MRQHSGSRITDEHRASLRRLMAPAKSAKPPVLYSLACVNCGDPFQAKRPEARTCSAKCRREKHARDHAEGAAGVGTAANT